MSSIWWMAKLVTKSALFLPLICQTQISIIKFVYQYYNKKWQKPDQLEPSCTCKLIMLTLLSSLVGVSLNGSLTDHFTVNMLFPSNFRSGLLNNISCGAAGGPSHWPWTSSSLLLQTETACGWSFLLQNVSSTDVWKERRSVHTDTHTLHASASGF